MGKNILKRFLAGTLAAVLTTAMVPLSITENIFGGIGEVKAANVSFIPMTIASGFNADVIMDKNETLGNQDAADQMVKLSSGGNCFYSASYTSSGGLPSNGVVQDKSGSVSGLSWTLGNYKSNNDMRLSPGQTGTFTFNTVGVYQKVYFLVTAGGIPGGSANMSTTINYSSGNPSTSTFTVVDWYSSTSYANATFMRTDNSGINGSTTGGPYFTRCVMSLDTTRLVNSITIKNTASSGVINVYAVTGETAAIAAPTGLKLEGCAALNATWDEVTGASTYRIDIARDQNFTQIVGDYNNKAVSTNSCQVKGLSTGVQYYARVRAVDKDGGQGPSSGIINCESAYSFTYSAIDNKFSSHCTIDGCDYDKDHNMTYTLKAEDSVYTRNPIPATLDTSNASFFTALTGFKVSDINYFRTSAYGSTSESGATALGTKAPRDVGYYFAKVTFSKNDTSYSIVKPYKIYLEEANYAQEKLNNLYSDEQQSTITKVRGDSATSNLRVVLNSSADQIKVYKIADMYYNDNNRDYDDLTWDTDAVTEWMAASSYGSDASYSEPKKVEVMTSSLQTKFYADMLTEEVKAATLVRDTADLSGNDVSGSFDEESGTYYTYFSNMEFGRYVVLATNSGGITYTPVVVDVIPYQNGPHTDWYVVNEFVAYLKEIVATVDKTINGHDVSDSVNYGEEVDFKVAATLPSMYTDRATLGATEYTLRIEDTMSSAFSLSSTPYLSYKVDTENIQLPETNFEVGKVYNYYVFSDNDASGSIVVTKDNAADYSYDGVTEHIVGLHAVPESGTLYNITSEANSDNGTTLITVNFNVPALKHYIKNGLAPMGISASDVIVYLNYKATVTDQAQIASEENTNIADVYFEKSTGEIDKTTDIVRGYTYGLQVVKEDGSDEGTYLAGARFRIFKEQEMEDTTEAVAAFEERGLNSGYYVYDDNVYVLYDKAINTLTGEEITGGEFTSVATADGVLLKGLSEGNYIIAEVQAPSGYNELAEDIMFTITRMEDEEAAQYHQGSLKFFYEMGDEEGTTKLNESSTILLTVLNYRGLTLPSTGGIGTLLFTIFGVVIMAAVILLLIIKRRKRTPEDYI
jgi:LPXTG-motif cell wall-anchored protein